MSKLISLILLACLLSLRCSAAIQVDWDFIATDCTSGGCVPDQTYPVPVATLVLPSFDSTGTAHFDGGSGPATYTGDPFSFDYSSDYRSLTQIFVQNNEPFGECEHRGEICQFDLSWTEVAGQLDALHLYVNAFNDTFLGRLDGATVASDNIYLSGAFTGCEGPPCQIAGSWVDAPADVSEPGTLAIILVGFAGIIARRRWGFR